VIGVHKQHIGYGKQRASQYKENIIKNFFLPIYRFGISQNFCKNTKKLRIESSLGKNNYFLVYLVPSAVKKAGG
jgi:hypothetical protein